MNMKRYRYNFYVKTIALALLLSTFSCSNFLEEDNKTGTTADLEYSTQSGIDGLVGSCYSFMRLWAGQAAGVGLGDSGSDMFYYGADCGLKPLGDYTFTAETDGRTCFEEYWEAFYCAVDVCNNALVYIPKNVNISDSKKNSYLGEVLFLKAYYYFLMVNIWGPIPYNDAPIKEVSSEATRMPEEEVYSKILANLDDAIGYLEQDDNDKSSCRVTSVACHAFKSRVLLYAASWLGSQSITTNENYTGKNLYQLSQTEAQKVIDSNFASFYDTTSDLWLMTNENLNVNTEAIWGLHYSSDVTTPANAAPIRYSTGAAYNKQMARGGTSRGGSMVLLTFVGLWNNSGSDLSDVFTRPTKLNTMVQGVVVNSYYSRYSRGFRNYIPTLYALNLFTKYKNTDQRYDAQIRDHYDIAPGLVSKKYPSMTDTAIYFLDVDADSDAGKQAIAYAKNRYRIYTRTGGDLPLYTSNIESEALPTSGIITPVSTVYGDNRYNTTQMAGESVFVALKKFEENCPDYSDNALITADISERDIMLIRLAEMYLIKAECQMQLGDNSGALSTINYLRAKRAIQGKDNTISGTVDMNTIMDERCLEFIGEQMRWFDLKRTHTLIDRVNSYNKQASVNIKSYHYYRPIPSSQIESVSNLSTVEGEGFWQNEGY
jgi:starch-binding outer membrane protein, SusD/RagB family